MPDHQESIAKACLPQSQTECTRYASAIELGVSANTELPPIPTKSRATASVLKECVVPHNSVETLKIVLQKWYRGTLPDSSESGEMTSGTDGVAEHIDAQHKRRKI